MADFFDAENDDAENDDDNGDGEEMLPEVFSGPTLFVNGATRRLEVGAPFLATCKNAAIQAGFGKFRVYLNSVEIRPSTAPQTIEPGHRLEIRPYDEAGYWEIAKLN